MVSNFAGQGRRDHPWPTKPISSHSAASWFRSACWVPT